MASYDQIRAELRGAQTMMGKFRDELSQKFPNISPMLPDAYSARLVVPDGRDISVSIPPGNGLLCAEVLYNDEVHSFYGEKSALETVAEVAQFIRSIILIAGGAVDTDAAETTKVSKLGDESETSVGGAVDTDAAETTKVSESEDESEEESEDRCSDCVAPLCCECGGAICEAEECNCFFRCDCCWSDDQKSDEESDEEDD